MIDVIGNTLCVGDVVLVALGAKGNHNNSGLTPCVIKEIRGNRCKIANDFSIVHNNKKPIITFSYSCKTFNKETRRYEFEYAEWKHSHQVVKVNDVLRKV